MDYVIIINGVQKYNWIKLDFMDKEKPVRGRPRKYKNTKLDDRINIRITPEMRKLAETIAEKTGMGTADVFRRFFSNGAEMAMKSIAGGAADIWKGNQDESGWKKSRANFWRVQRGGTGTEYFSSIVL